jgi:hypothetical protein
MPLPPIPTPAATSPPAVETIGDTVVTIGIGTNPLPILLVAAVVVPKGKTLVADTAFTAGTALGVALPLAICAGTAT